MSATGSRHIQHKIKNKYKSSLNSLSTLAWSMQRASIQSSLGSLSRRTFRSAVSRFRLIVTSTPLQVIESGSVGDAQQYDKASYSCALSSRTCTAKVHNIRSSSFKLGARKRRLRRNRQNVLIWRRHWSNQSRGLLHSDKTVCRAVLDLKIAESVHFQTFKDNEELWRK